MMEYKNIDRLFQEQLKDIEASPSSNVWHNIETKLAHKKQKKRPIWWVFGGVAALLMLFFFITNTSTSEKDLQPIPIEKIITHTEKEKREETTPKTVSFDKKTMVSVKKQIINKEKNNGKKSLETPQKQHVLIAEKTILPPQKTNKKTETSVTNSNIQNTLKKHTVIPKESIAKKTEKNLESKNNIKKPFSNREFSTKSIIKSEKKTTKKWTLSPVVALVNTVAISNESDAGVSNFPEIFSPVSNVINNRGNNKAYGVKIEYRFHKKWGFKSGVYLQEHRFSTSNISVVSNTTTGAISYYSGSNFNNFSNLVVTSTVLNSNAKATKTYNYIEIPLEVTYNVLKIKKFTTRAVVGFSTLFLTKNNTTITSPSFFKNFGKDNNLNTVNFSGNIGFDFDYSLGEKWKLNVNPMLKKQLNTFKNTPTNYDSFLLGIYTGIKYQF